MSTVLIIDTYNLLHRARHTAFSGGSHGITFNFFRNIRPIIEKFTPSQIFFVLEGHPKIRTEASKDYKANRPKEMNPAMIAFLREKDEIISLLKAYFPVTVIRHPDYECDDVIANVIRYPREAGVLDTDSDFVVASGDSDFIQLHDKHNNVRIYHPIKHEMIEKWPCDYVTWKSLKGDSTDNIDGIKGIGDKTAKKLVTQFPKIEDLRAHLDAIRHGHVEKFDHNLKMIAFHDMGRDGILSSETSVSKWNAEDARMAFALMEFKSIVNDRSWKKFSDTFASVNCGQ